MKIGFIVTGIMTLTCSATALASPQAYIIDPDHTSVIFRVDHLGFSQNVGLFTKVGGNIMFDEAEPSRSSVSVQIEGASVMTNNAARDNFVREKILDTTSNPSISFASSAVHTTGEKTGVIDGTLTIRGVTKPVTLNVAFNKSGLNPLSKKQAIGFSGTASFKRSDFGSTVFLGPVGDVITATIEVEARKAE